MDKTSVLVEKAILTTAKEHDRTQLKELMGEECEQIIADKGYADKVERSIWKKQGIKVRIMHHGYHKHPLTRAQIKYNKKIGKVRSRVERVFAHWKQWQGYRKVRYVGWLANQLELSLKAIAYNLKRIANMKLKTLAAA